MTTPTEEPKPPVIKQPELKDYYHQEHGGDFVEPCNTCIYKFQSVKQPSCPCLKCIHYWKP